MPGTERTLSDGEFELWYISKLCRPVKRERNSWTFTVNEPEPIEIWTEGEPPPIPRESTNQTTSIKHGPTKAMLRKRQKVPDVRDPGPYQFPQPDEALELKELADILNEALQDLNPKYSAAIEMRFYERMTIRDIASAIHAAGGGSAWFMIKYGLSKIRCYLRRKRLFNDIRS